MVLEKSVLVPEEKPSSTFEMYPRKSSPQEQPKETLMGYRFYQPRTRRSPVSPVAW